MTHHVITSRPLMRTCEKKKNFHGNFVIHLYIDTLRKKI